MKRVLITGGNGFIGANLVRRFLQDGHAVHLIASGGNTSWRLRAVRDQVVVHPADLRDAEAVHHAVAAARPDWVFHLAVHGAYSWQTDVRAIVETNVLGTVNLVQACLRTGFEVFVNTGSSSEYGWKDHAPAENTWLEPNSNYAVTKASATLFCRHTARATNTVIPTLRLYSVYGPYEEPNRFMPALLVHGLEGRHPPLASPAVSRDYVHVADALEAYVLAATRPHREPGAVYNLGTGRQFTLREVVDLAASLFEYRGPAVWGSMPDRQWDTTVWVADSRKIRDELGWEPRITLEAGLREFVAWFREHAELLELYRSKLGITAPPGDSCPGAAA